jgi:(p)ppGpp synthase/HD superfamily hydrolase
VGDRVEILTAKKGGPSRDWLNPGLGLIHTSRAREKVRQWFKQQARTEAITDGREILDKELHRLGFGQRNFDEIAKMFNYKSPDDFLEALGHEDVSIATVGIKLFEAERAKDAPEEEIIAPARPLPKLPETKATVKGVGNLLQHLARCCSPLPGDDVIGFITRGRGITIHRRDCKNVLEISEQERLIAVDWNQAEQAVYPVQVQVRAFDRAGLVHDISGIVAGEGINMASTNAIAGRKDHISTITATLEISNAGQLTRILNKIDRLPNVIEVRRVTSGE